MSKNKKYGLVHAVVIILTFFVLNQFFPNLKLITGLAIVLVVELALQAIKNLFFNDEDNGNND